ncbi:MAG: Ig-like domain-containing protein [Pirellulales bacterium]
MFKKQLLRLWNGGGAARRGGGPRRRAASSRGNFEMLEYRRLLAAWTQQAELLSASLSAEDRMGQSVAIEGNYAVVGAFRDDFGASQTANEGRVFVYKRTGSSWSPVATLTASDAMLGDQFGSAVAISGGTIVVAAIGDDGAFADEGSVYVFEPSGTDTWTETAHLRPVPDFVGQATNGENFGESVAIEGNTIVVGSRSDNNAAGVIVGSAYVFRNNGSGWTVTPSNPPQKLRASDGAVGDRFGFDVAISFNRIVVGAPFDDAAATDDGSVYVFDRPGAGSPFAEVAKIVATGDQSNNDEFGTSVAVEGSTILVGAPKENTNGAAYVLTGGGAVWSQQAKLSPSSGSLFGTAVDLQGDLAVVGANGGVNGAAFAFAKNAGVWGVGNLITAGDPIFGDADSFGQSVALDAGFIVVGSPLHDHTAANSNSGSAYIFVDPNDAPVNSVPGPQAINEGGSLSFSVGGGNAISIGDVDAFGAAVRVTLSATNGTLTLGGITGLTFGAGTGTGDATMTFDGTIAAINAALDGTVFTPSDADYFGPASVAILTNDLGNTGTGGPQTDSDAVSITVNPINDAPTLATAADHTSNEDAGLQSVVAFATASAGPANESDQTLTYNVTMNTNSALFAVQPAIAMDGTLSYTAAADANGSATIAVEVMDNGGTANGGVDTSLPAVFTITVNAVNDAPTFVAGGDDTVNEDAGARTVTAWATAISTGPADEAGQTRSFGVTGNTNPGLFASGPAIDPTTGDLTYTPAADANGAATITVVLTDGGGTANGGIDTSTAAVFTITVNPLNDAPTANGQTVNVTEDGQVTIVLSGADVETAEADLTFTITSLPASGVLTFGGSPVQIGDTFAGPPSLVYAPAAGSSVASASFTFTVTDRGDPDNAPGDVAQTSAAATVTINIVPAVADGTAVLSGGILRVGGGGGNDTLLVSRVGSTTLRVSINGSTTDFPLASVTEIRVWGRDGNDTIVVDTSVSVNATIDAGGGNDIAYGGNGHDLIFGGGGVDLLFGNGGNDMLIGGAGSDLLVGGSGHDVLVAGSVSPLFTAAMLRDVAQAWAANRTATAGADDGTLDESAVDGEVDVLSGGSGADWFIINVGDWVIGYWPFGSNGDLITYV